jgi:hypothetical protein
VVSSVSAIYSLVAFYDTLGRKGELFFYFVPDTIQDTRTKLLITLISLTDCDQAWVHHNILEFAVFLTVESLW